MKSCTTQQTATSANLRTREALCNAAKSASKVGTRASQGLDLIHGLSMRAPLSAPRETLVKDAEEAADLVLLPRLGPATPRGDTRCRGRRTENLHPMLGHGCVGRRVPACASDGCGIVRT